MARAEIVHEDSTLRIGVAGSLFIVAWSDAPSANQMRAMIKARQTLAARHHENVATMNVVLSGTPRFTDAVRDEAVRMMRDPRLQGHGTAHVILVGGLIGSTVRAFLSTVFLLGRPSSPNKVFGDLRAAAAWLAPLLSRGGVVWTADDVLAAQAEVTRAGAALAS